MAIIAGLNINYSHRAETMWHTEELEFVTRCKWQTPHLMLLNLLKERTSRNTLHRRGKKADDNLIKACDYHQVVELVEQPAGALAIN